MSLPYQLAPQIGTKGRLGFILLSADETLEEEWAQVRPKGDIASFTTRITSGDEVSAESLTAMKTRLTDVAATLPKAVPFDVVAYACTSASAVIGTDEVAQRIKAGCNTTAVTDPVSALIWACKKHNLKRLALISPYTKAVNDSLRQTLSTHGVETPVFASFKEPVETHVARIREDDTYEAAMSLGTDPQIDAVFLSCTNLRTAQVLGRLEDTLGKPVLSSNSVLFAHMLSLT